MSPILLLFLFNLLLPRCSSSNANGGRNRQTQKVQKGALSSKNSFGHTIYTKQTGTKSSTKSVISSETDVATTAVNGLVDFRDVDGLRSTLSKYCDVRAVPFKWVSKKIPTSLLVWQQN